MTFAAVLQFALRFWRPLAAAAVVLALVAGFFHWKRGVENTGVAKERGRVADSTLAVVTPERIRVETLVVTRTRDVTRTIARVDTLRLTVLERLTDTIFIKEYIARTDTALAVCADLARDCASFRLLANAELAALRAKVAVQPVTQRRSCTVPALASFAGGLLGGAVVVRFAR